MALVIENGTIVANATSLVTLAELRAYALQRGVTLSAVDAELEIHVIKAMDYMESIEERYQGDRTSNLQTLPFPRTGMVINKFDVDANSIPLQAKRAQMQLAIYSADGIDLMPMTTEVGIKSEKIGPMETVYDTENFNLEPELPLAYSWLNLLFTSKGEWSLTVTRV